MRQLGIHVDVELGIHLDVELMLCGGLVDVYGNRVLLHIYSKRGVEGSGVWVVWNGMHDIQWIA